VGLRKEISNVGGGFYFAWWVGVIPCLNVLGMTALQNIAKESLRISHREMFLECTVLLLY
jgi:hypothetical protein